MLLSSSSQPRSSFERFLMTTTARDLDHLRPKIFLHRFSPALGLAGKVIIRPGASSGPQIHQQSDLSQIDETRSPVITTNCHILPFLFLLTIFSSIIIFLPKDQQNYESISKTSSIISKAKVNFKCNTLL